MRERFLTTHILSFEPAYIRYIQILQKNATYHDKQLFIQQFCLYKTLFRIYLLNMAIR